MSCNGCRILRKGCSEDCILRHCLQFIDDSQAQANATVFVAKFFGRACLMSFISSVPCGQRPSLFQSLLYEAVGRTINPVGGTVGLLWTGNWDICQKAVMKVLRGGAIEPLLELEGGILQGPDFDNISECASASIRSRNHNMGSSGSTKTATLKRKRDDNNDLLNYGQLVSLELCLMHPTEKKPRAATSSAESETTTLGSGSRVNSTSQEHERKLLTLFL